MARQATTGRDGVRKFSINIPVRIGRDDLLKAIFYYRPVVEEGELPVTRTDAKRLARDYLASFGTTGCQNGNYPEPNPNRWAQIETHVDSLFSELVPENPNPANE